MLNGALVENLNTHKVRLRFNNQVQILRQRDHFIPEGPLTLGERVYHQAMLLSGGDPEGSLEGLRRALNDYIPPEGCSPCEIRSAAVACRAIESFGQQNSFYDVMVTARFLIALEDPLHPVLPRTEAPSD